MPDIQLIVTMTDTGQVGVQGPIDNPILCYGLLEIARQSIQAHIQKKGENLIQPVHGSFGLPPIRS